MIERLLERGIIVAKYGGSGSRGSNSGGSRGGGTGGNQRGGGRGNDGRGSNSTNKSKNERNDRNNQSANQGRGGQADVGGRGTPSRDSADNEGATRSGGNGGGRRQNRSDTPTNRERERSRAPSYNRRNINSTHPVARTLAREAFTSRNLAPEDQRTELGKGGQTPNSSMDGVGDRAIGGAGVSPREHDMAVDARRAFDTHFAANRVKDGLSVSGINTATFGLANTAVDAVTGFMTPNTYGASYGAQVAETTQMPSLASGALGVTNTLGLTSMPSSVANFGYSMAAANQHPEMRDPNAPLDGPSINTNTGGRDLARTAFSSPTTPTTPTAVAASKPQFAYSDFDVNQFGNGLMAAKV